MEYRTTLATASVAFLFAIAFLVMGQLLPPGNNATPAGLALGVMALLACNTYRTLNALTERVERMERDLRDRLGGRTRS
jgi:hypothetical protein